MLDHRGLSYTLMRWSNTSLELSPYGTSARAGVVALGLVQHAHQVAAAVDAVVDDVDGVVAVQCQTLAETREVFRLDRAVGPHEVEAVVPVQRRGRDLDAPRAMKLDQAAVGHAGVFEEAVGDGADPLDDVGGIVALPVVVVVPLDVGIRVDGQVVAHDVEGVDVDEHAGRRRREHAEALRAAAVVVGGEDEGAGPARLRRRERAPLRPFVLVPAADDAVGHVGWGGHLYPSH